ncbi:uncharacterized protein K460DRAFT_417100 [Cucurbitaria berberidis CBS 394.84]|uniref:Uncharacterized protein n=1 Tax=Cucurbitaria berberidis CBS 394.84 TaxID=1168544 RepID=A0A9P4L970_9PLEO|nr:uncharacterized protein K460DRAFT_417100 [Cucurbitaria berberidis CBS 394.84]KAF1845914.1 hypothetical protein K460DRAFT_417100 [Cucurbitaria berberidis CBS 394.84]
MTLPIDNRRFYLDTDTCIAIIHELETIEDRAAPRNDSVVNTISGRDLFRWQTLFGLTASEAGFELLIHRTKQIEHRHTPKPRTLEQWPWERCERMGFDRESYDYWLEKADKVGLLGPKETAAWVSYKTAKFDLFVLRSVDAHINRAHWAPFINRKAIHHTVYDWKGFQHYAIVLRD